MGKRAIIAIDGPAASGKGADARRYALPHLGAGLLYRATAAALIAAGHDLADEPPLAAARALGLTDFDETGKRPSASVAGERLKAAFPGRCRQPRWDGRSESTYA